MFWSVDLDYNAHLNAITSAVQSNVDLLIEISLFKRLNGKYVKLSTTFQSLIRRRQISGVNIYTVCLFKGQSDHHHFYRTKPQTSHNNDS